MAKRFWRGVEAVQELEVVGHRRAVVEALRDHRPQSLVELLDRPSELVPALFELLLLKVHDVVLRVLHAVHRKEIA